MTCEQALLLLSGHLDGQNTPEEEAALLQHLADCPSCNAILQAYEAADQAVAQLEAEPPAALLCGVMERIELDKAGVAQPKKRRFFFGPGTAIAAVAAALLLILGTGNFQNLQLGKTSTAEATPQTQDVAPMQAASPDASAEAALIPAPASIDAPPVADPAPTSEGETDAPQVNANLVGPKIGTRGVQDQSADVPDMVDGVPHLLIMENAEKPALDTIAALQSLETMTDEAGGVWYMTDAKTARAIAADFAEDYEMQTYLLGDETEDFAVCVIAVQ